MNVITIFLKLVCHIQNSAPELIHLIAMMFNDQLKERNTYGLKKVEKLICCTLLLTVLVPCTFVMIIIKEKWKFLWVPRMPVLKVPKSTVPNVIYFLLILLDVLLLLFVKACVAWQKIIFFFDARNFFLPHWLFWWLWMGRKVYFLYGKTI